MYHHIIIQAPQAQGSMCAEGSIGQNRKQSRPSRKKGLESSSGVDMGLAVQNVKLGLRHRFVYRGSAEKFGSCGRGGAVGCAPGASFGDDGALEASGGAGDFPGEEDVSAGSGFPEPGVSFAGDFPCFSSRTGAGVGFRRSFHSWNSAPGARPPMESSNSRQRAFSRA